MTCSVFGGPTLLSLVSADDLLPASGSLESLRVRDKISDRCGAGFDRKVQWLSAIDTHTCMVTTTLNTHTTGGIRPATARTLLVKHLKLGRDCVICFWFRHRLLHPYQISYRGIDV